jgi:hypothetical protein
MGKMDYVVVVVLTAALAAGLYIRLGLKLGAIIPGRM